MNSRIEDRNEYIKNNGYRGKYENPAYHNGSFAGILVFMNMFHAVTGPIAVNTWGIPLDSGRVMIVDPGGDVDRIIAYLGELNSQLAVIMCTHGHLDHLLAVPELVFLGKCSTKRTDLSQHNQYYVNYKKEFLLRPNPSYGRMG